MEVRVGRERYCRMLPVKLLLGKAHIVHRRVVAIQSNLVYARALEIVVTYVRDLSDLYAMCKMFSSRVANFPPIFVNYDGESRDEDETARVCARCDDAFTFARNPRYFNERLL